MADLSSFAGDDSRGKSHPIAADMPSNDELTRRFLASYPSQVPASFAISQLPDEIPSWTTQVLQVAESYLTADKRAAMSHSTKAGKGGSGTVATSATALTPPHSVIRRGAGPLPQGLPQFLPKLRMGCRGQTYGRSLRTSGREYSAQNRKQPGCGVLGPYRGQPPAPQRISKHAPVCQSMAQGVRQCRPPEAKTKGRDTSAPASNVRAIGSGNEVRKRHHGRSHLRGSDRGLLLHDDDSFFDATDSRRASQSNPRTRTKAGTLLANGGRKTANRMYIHH